MMNLLEILAVEPFVVEPLVVPLKDVPLLLEPLVEPLVVEPLKDDPLVEPLEDDDPLLVERLYDDPLLVEPFVAKGLSNKQEHVSQHSRDSIERQFVQVVVVVTSRSSRAPLFLV